MIFDGVRMSLKDVKKHIKKTQKPHEKIKMYTNPYNTHVIKLHFYREYDTGIDYGFGTWIEELTDNTEKELLKLADEHEHGRFW